MAHHGSSAGDPAHVVDAFEEMPAVLFAFEGPQHRVVAANRAARAVSGNRPKLLGLPVREALAELEGQQIFELLDEVYATGRSITQPERRVLVDRFGDGTLHEGYFTYTFVATHGTDGTVRGIVVHAVETTELVRQREAAESRALDSERRYRAAHEVVVALQRDLLPDGVPVLPRLRLAARYVVADREAAAGGDLFDAIPLPDGRVALLVGDVVGHGASAAAAMGQLRAIALEALASGSGIAETLMRLDTLATRLPAAAGATICLVVLDPRTGDIRYAGCAHPPVLVLDRIAGHRFLDGSPGGPLGGPLKPGERARAVYTDRIRVGELLLLYSDGLIERPGRSLTEGYEDLARVAAAAVRAPARPDTSVPPVLVDRVCALVVERFALSGYGDDATLLAAEVLPTDPERLTLELPARPAYLAPVRHALREWLDRLDASAADINAVLHAVGEACANVVEHAYRGAPDGPLCVEGRLEPDGTATVKVVDHGRWRPPEPDPAGRGRGLMMMRGLLDRVDLDTTATGTTVTLRHRLSRPVAIGTLGPVTAAIRTEPPFETELIRSQPPVLRVRGAIDQSTVAKLQLRIMEAARGGELPVTVDLSEVSHLASAGLRLLHELVGQGRTGTGAAELRLIAPEGSATEQVLRLTGLAHLLATEPANT